MTIPDKNQPVEQKDKTLIKSNINTDVLIIGAGASGLYCAMTAAKRGRNVLVIDHANKAGKKILMSGGGRCNFTNYFIEPDNFIGENPHFCKSALSRYNCWQFISLVEKHNIAYYEKEHGQLFCQNSSKDILNMLLNECQHANVKIQLNTQVYRIQPINSSENCPNSPTKNFIITTNGSPIYCQSLVIATGGLSIPTMGATGFGYQVAEQFGHTIIPTSAGLVPFVFSDHHKDMMQSLAGISHTVIASNKRIAFHLPMLFTHRGLSGPAILQLSNYWQQGESININLVPDIDLKTWLLQQKRTYPKQRLRTVLADFFVKKLLLVLQEYLWADIQHTELANIKDQRLIELATTLNHWQLKPSSTEGYRTAEVTRGGIATKDISPKTFESKRQANLYFIGEVLDITGWLGGYNFQWAWASGYSCGLVA